jgi:hypothetical protein
MAWDRIATRIATTSSRVVGDAVVINGLAGFGILQTPRDELINGMIMSTGYRLELPVEVFGNVLEGTNLTVNGTSYRAIEDSMPMADGAITSVPLEQTAGATIYSVDGDWL